MNKKNTPLKKIASGTTLLYGTHAVCAALKNPYRDFIKLFVSHKTKTLASNLPQNKIEQRNSAFFKSLLPPGSVHQEIALECMPLAYPNLNQFLKDPKEQDFLLILDQIQDPHNLGAIIRSAVAFGASAIITQVKHAAPLTGLVAKIASGALENLPILYVGNLSQAIHTLKENNYWITGLDERGEKIISEIDFSGKSALVLGAEGKGLRDLTRKSADQLCRLPTSQLQASLNVSNAAAIALYEINRQALQKT